MVTFALGFALGAAAGWLYALVTGPLVVRIRIPETLTPDQWGAYIREQLKSGGQSTEAGDS